ncbi:hypothetical protein MTBLM5_110064 [Magnetospirillum sp. LM-5]|nr:hypothetical protein MTBLM5_110064 [Magnetospirillum sp. LM-5]
MRRVNICYCDGSKSHKNNGKPKK